MLKRKLAAAAIAVAMTLTAGAATVSGAIADDNTAAAVAETTSGTLVAEYNFDAGNYKDTSGKNAADLTVANGAKWEYYSDANSNALSVRGNSQYAETGAGVFNGVSEGLSFSIKAKTRNVEKGDVAVTVGASADKYLILRLQGTKATAAVTTTGRTGEAGAQASKDVNTAGWHYYTVTFGDGALTLFVDGVEAGKVETALKPSDLGEGAALKSRFGEALAADGQTADGTIDAAIDDIKFFDGAAAVSNHDIGIDLNQSTGAVEYGATGFLYGLADDGVPTDTMLQGLGHLHTQVGRPTDGEQHPNGDSIETAPQWFRNGGKFIQIYLKDMYPVPWPYPKYSPSLEKDYLPKIKNQMDAAKKSGVDTSKIILITFNEPDLGDANYRGSKDPSSDGFKRLLADWDTMYRYIKQYNKDNGTEFQVGGPNYNYYYDGAYDAFLKHAVEAGTVPDVVSWHELNGQEAQGFLPHYKHWKSIEKKYLGDDSNIPVSINEYSTKGSPQVTPGTLVQYISHFENTKVSAALPYWYPSGDLDQLTVRNNQATSTWWLYNWYGQLSGNTVKVNLKDDNQRTQAVASYDKTTKQTKIVFGGAENGVTSLTDTLKIDGADTKYPDGAHITVYGVDATASASDPTADGYQLPEVSKGTYVQWQGDATAAQLADGLALAGLKAGSAYYAVITPGQTGGTTGSQTDGVYEAEYTHVADEKNNISKTLSIGYGDGANGAGYVTGFDKSGNGDATKFFVTSDKDGYADLTVRYSATKSGKLAVSINRGSALTVDLPSTGGQWKEAVIRVYLPLGISQIDFAAPEEISQAEGVKLDGIKVASVDADSATSAKYEAESEANTFKGAGTADASNASGGKVATFVGNGNTLTFNNVKADEAGDYTLTIGYANYDIADNNPYQTKSRWANVSVNGGEAQQVVFANTHGWDTFWTTSIHMTLKQGDNTITLSGAKNGWAPNFDYVQIGRTAVQTSKPQEPEPETKPVTGIEVSGKDKLEVGDSTDLVVSVTPDDATNKTVEWSSTEPKVATVDSSTGKVTAVAAGKATIVATAKDGSKVSGSLEITVSSKDGGDSSGDTGNGNGVPSGDDSGEKSAHNVLGRTGATVGVIAGIAIVLAVCGAAFVYRRRRSVHRVC